MEEGTSLPKEGSEVDHLLRELDCFELKGKIEPTEEKATQTEPEQTNLPSMQCPIHQVSVVDMVAKNGWEYAKCPQPHCWLFVAKSEVSPYMRAVHDQLHPALEQMWQSFVCFCRCSLTLRMSRSQKNPGRLYLGCNKRECHFFQWADVPLTQKNGEWFETRMCQDRHMHYPSLDAEGYPLRGYDIPGPTRPTRDSSTNLRVDAPLILGSYGPELKEQWMIELRAISGMKPEQLTDLLSRLAERRRGHQA